MADEKPKPAAPERDLFRESIEWILLLLVLGVVYVGISNAVEQSTLFRHGWTGLTPHGIVLADTRPIDSLANPIGTSVISSQDSTIVYNSAGGSELGTQGFDASGTIIGGPVTENGVTYYDVDFAKPPSGWVDENNIAYVQSQPGILAHIILFVWTLIDYIRFFLWLVAIASCIGIVILVRKLTAVRLANHARLYPEHIAEEEKTIHPRWQKVQLLLASTNESDWRQAIIESDIMLADLLDTMSLLGDSIGDKLKAVDKSDFLTLDAAWEAHKVRNEIAHSGSDFHLTDREARRVVGLYESVFKEFSFI